MICEWYRINGYDFLALSDHNVLSKGEKWIDEGEPAKRGAIGGIERYISRFGSDWVQQRTVDGRREIRLKPLSEFRALFEQRGKFILIQGEEITDAVDGLPVHINATNLEQTIRPQGGSDVREVMRRNLLAVTTQSKRLGQPILAHLNHPNFGYAITAEDLAHVVEERFFEIFNGHPSVNQKGDEQHASVEQIWDIANTIRLGSLKSPPLYGVATDDSHNYFGRRDASPGRGWIMVQAKHLTPESILRSMSQARFYASSGVLLQSVEYDAEQAMLTIRIDARPEVRYETRFVGTLADYVDRTEPATDEQGEPIRATRRYSEDVGKSLATVHGTTATYQLTGKELYVRAIVTSSEAPENPVTPDQRQQAWTQPVGWKKWVSSQTFGTQKDGRDD